MTEQERLNSVFLWASQSKNEKVQRLYQYIQDLNKAIAEEDQRRASLFDLLAMHEDRWGKVGAILEHLYNPDGTQDMTKKQYALYASARLNQIFINDLLGKEMPPKEEIERMIASVWAEIRSLGCPLEDLIEMQGEFWRTFEARPK